MDQLFFQVKAIRKGIKPPRWRRAYVPGNITFAQMAAVLEEILDLPASEWYEFEFFNSKYRFIEWHEEDDKISDFYYTYLNAPDTFVNEWMLQNSWFTFRIRSGHGECPEYRIEIEKALSQIFLGKEKEPLTYPLILKEISIKEDDCWMGRTIVSINDILREKYFLTERKAEYLGYVDLKNNILGGQGIRFCREMVNREIHFKYSANFQISRFAEQIGNLLYEEGIDVSKDGLKKRFENEKSIRQIVPLDNGERISLKDLKRRNPSMEEALMAYTKQDLSDIAEKIGYSLTVAKKEKIVYELARYLLEPQNMRNLLLRASEEELDFFEAAMKRGCFVPSKEEESLLETIYDLCYITEFEDGAVEIPVEVCTVYEILLKNDYRSFHKKAYWLLQCMYCFNWLLAVAPVKILYRMYLKDKNMEKDFSSFMNIWNKIPEALKSSLISDGKVIDKGTLKDNLYLKIQEQQINMDYYIPERQEIIAFDENSYPANEEAYRKLSDFFREDMKLEKSECHELCVEAFRLFSAGGGIKDYLDFFYSKEIGFSSDTQIKKLVDLLTDVNNNTRMFRLKGHKPLEVLLQMSPEELYGDYEKPVIVPMSSVAAQLLETGRDELEKMGVEVDVESNAAEIPVLHFGNGLKGESGREIRKIYPNDPCPCGSGKKYKKCCGRK